MLLRRLLDPDETARRRRLRAQIVRRNRIHRELVQGLEPKWRRVPRGPARTVHDYGWNPLEDGSAAVADQRRVENEGNALAFLVKASTPSEGIRPAIDARARSPAVMEGVQQVPARFANRTKTEKPSGPGPIHSHASSVHDNNARSSSIHQQSKSGGLPRPKPVNEGVRKRWQDAFQRIMIQRHEDVLRKDAKRPWRHERLGLLLFQRQGYTNARDHLIDAIKLGSTKSICWRRLAECHYYDYNARHDWDALWDAKAAFEQALNHVEMASNPYVMYEYARVLEVLGSYDSALHACAALLASFPRFAQRASVQLRFVLLQQYQFLTQSELMNVAEKERALTKCIDITKSLLLDKTVTQGSEYSLVLYTHVRLNELLYETARVRGDGPNTIAKAAKTSADVGTEELFKLAGSMGLVKPSTMPWKRWWLESETYLQFADYFQGRNENIAAADALGKALEFMENPPAIAAAVAVGRPPPKPTGMTVERKIALYTAMAINYYEGNQMERAIRAMETIFQLDPYADGVRERLSAWFPSKWKDRLELEDASQVQIARVLRGLWGRRKALSRQREVEKQLEAAYLAQPYHPLHRRNVVHWLRSKYAPLFLAQEIAARRVQHVVRKYLSTARIRWTFQARRDKVIRDLRAKHSTRKYRYNRHVRFQLAQLVPDEFDARFRREDCAVALVQRWFRGACVRKAYCARIRAIKVQEQREYEAASTLQRAYRAYRQRRTNLARMQANAFFLEAQRRLEDMQEHLAVQLQRLYRQWKHRLVLATRRHLQAIARHKQYEVQSRSAAAIQRQWRRFVRRKRGGKSSSEASILLEELRRGHARVLAEQAEAYRVEWEGSARKIQAAYRGRCVRKSLVKITRQSVAPAASEITQLLEATDQRVVLKRLETIAEKRALFDAPIVVLRPTDSSVELPLNHVTAAIQHSAVLHTLVLDGGDWQRPRIDAVLGALSFSKTLRVFAVGNVRLGRRRRVSLSSPDVPEDADDDDEGTDTDEGVEHVGDRNPSVLNVLYETLRTKTFLLEQLLLDGNDLLCGRDAASLAQIVGDYFYGRYGKLRVLAAQRMALSDDGGAAFGDALAINTVLQRLNLSGNAIRDAGATAIAGRGLCANATLLYLNLADNAIGSAGAKALFHSLETTNRTLQTLILANNLIMNDAVASLFQMLQVNAVIDTVDVRGNLIHADHVDTIDAALRERASTTNEDLRLFVARRRLSGWMHGGNAKSPLSPVRRTGSTGKRSAAPLSPQKWIKAHAGSFVPGMIQPPCVVFKETTRFATYPSPTSLTGKASGNVDALLFSPSKKRQKPPHKVETSTTRLPVLLTSPPKASRPNHRY